LNHVLEELHELAAAWLSWMPLPRNRTKCRAHCMNAVTPVHPDARARAPAGRTDPAMECGKEAGEKTVAVKKGRE